MGKRSNYEHNPRDFYVTPFKAVLPLIPHLRGVRTFAEPCCGDGSLVCHLESFRLRCTYAGDIATDQEMLERGLTVPPYVATGQDALARDSYGDADVNITNPPFDTDNGRKLMHALIRHLSGIAPTWLLIHSDWATNEHAAPYLPQCSDIVIIGRVQWIPDSDGGGMENFAWYRFDARHSGGPILHNNRGKRGAVLASSRASLCRQCGTPYRPQRSDSKFCSATCRKRAERSRLAVTKRDMVG